MFDNLINKLKNTNDNTKLYELFINPFSLIYICDHYLLAGEHKNIIKIPENKNDLNNNDLSLIKDYDIIYVQVYYFSYFCNEILNKINKKIILATGQWQFPRIEKNELTEKILNSDKILLWISQNPIYPNSLKYIAYPYGLMPGSLDKYKDFLLNNNINKTKYIVNLPFKTDTNKCRQKLPSADRISPNEFYSKIAESKFVLSPIGDRDDCFRHYECIGLGTIPISNVHHFYKNIFKNNMYYCDIDKMVKILNKNEIDMEFKEPNKDLICSEYYEKKIFNLINHLKLYGTITTITINNDNIGNQIIRNLAVSLIAEKHNLNVIYNSHQLMEELGINLYSGTNIHDDIITLNDTNYFSTLNSESINSNLNPNYSYFQTKDITNYLYNYLNKDEIKKNVIIKNPFNDKYNNNDDLFIHVMLQDADKKHPDINDYLNTINNIKYKNIYLSTDDATQSIVKELMKTYEKIILLNYNEIKTLQFASTCKNIILSYSSLSAVIGYLSFYSNINFIEYDSDNTCNNMFSIEGWNKIRV
jgi:hypothetical protein